MTSLEIYLTTIRYFMPHFTATRILYHGLFNKLTISREAPQQAGVPYSQNVCKKCSWSVLELSRCYILVENGRFTNLLHPWSVTLKWSFELVVLPLLWAKSLFLNKEFFSFNRLVSFIYAVEYCSGLFFQGELFKGVYSLQRCKVTVLETDYEKS